MKRILLSTFCFWLFSFDAKAIIKYWSFAGSGNWSVASNWSPVGVPTSSDDVVLDNSIFAGSYVVTLPSIAITISIKTLQITPTGSNNITLIIPMSNTADPGLSVTGSGDALIINANGILQNSTGVASGGIGLNITNTFRINNNGHYIHNNARANAPIVSQLSNAIGTETGIFEYDVPTASAFAISLSGRTYGTLIFSSYAAGTNKTYTGNGASDLTIKGNLILNSQANLNSTITANIRIAADLIMNGNFDNTPQSPTLTRGIVFNGTTNQTISGSGSFTFGVDFNSIKINKNSIVTMARNITINSGDSLIVDTSATLNMGTNVVSGAGKFINYPKSYLSLGNANGISSSGATGNVQTGTRIFDALANYEYNGTAIQNTGNGLPASIAQLVINNSNGVNLNSNVFINDSLSLNAGKFFTSASTLPILAASATVHSGPSNYLNLTPYPNNIGTVNSYVIGPIRKVGLSNQTFAFPVGNFLHRPLILKNATGDFEVAYVELNPHNITNGTVMDAALDHVSYIEYWTINSSSGSANVEATFYDPNSGGVTDMAALRVGQHDGAKWNDRGNISTLGTPGSNGSVTGNAVTINALTPFTLASVTNQNPLPIFLKYFQLQSDDLSNYVKWGIENDMDYKNYILEKSPDGINFTEVNNQYAKAANTLTWYNFKDNATATCFYRLKIIGNNGKIFNSNIIKAKREFSYLVYPNPADKEIHIKMPSSSSISTIEIVNSSGRVTKLIQTNASSTTINIQSLSKGMYFIRFRNQTEVISQRFFKR